MRYVISDIHGCYEEYRELLEKIHLTDNDMLYILGDTLDKGPEPIKVLQDLMCRKNVIYIIGNHDYLFLYFMQKLKSTYKRKCSFFSSGDDLLSRAASRQVSSALQSLTTVFGMGTGVTSASLSPNILL